MHSAVTADAHLEQWYREHGAVVHAAAAGLLGSRELAQDVVQETFVKAWRHRHALDPAKGSIRGWLLRVAHNVAVDRIRAGAARPVEVPEQPGFDVAVPDHADGVLRRIWVRDILADLSPLHREVLYEMFYRDRTAAGAAAVLGLPVGTVKSRLFYGLRHLRDLAADRSDGGRVPVGSGASS